MPANSKECFLPSNSKECFLPANRKEPLLPTRSSKESLLHTHIHAYSHTCILTYMHAYTKSAPEVDATPPRKLDTDLRKKLCSQNMSVNKITFWTLSSDSFYSDSKDALTMSKHSSENCDWSLFALSWFYSQECFSTHGQTYLHTFTFIYTHTYTDTCTHAFCSMHSV